MKCELPKNILINAAQNCPFVSTCIKYGISNPCTKYKNLMKLCPYMSQQRNGSEKTKYDQIFTEKVEEKKQNNTYRVFNRISRLASDFTKAEYIEPSRQIAESGNDPKLVSVWCSNDYLGMSRHPKIIRAAVEATVKYGVGSGGTRNISGNNAFHEMLESTVAQWYKKEAGLLFTSCYVANSTSLTTLAKILPNCVIFSDQGNHASMIEGIRNSGCRKIIYKHNDIDDLESHLTQFDDSFTKIVAFESINSMNGSVAPIPHLCALARKHGAITFVDEVHAVGLYGDGGSGLSEELQCLSQVDIISGTLGKAVGSIGGFIVGNANLIDMIRSYAPGLIFTTSLPPAVVSAAIESIKILKSPEGVELRKKHQNVVADVRKQITQLGIPLLPSLSHIIPVYVGDSALCRQMGKYMMDAFNVYVQPINYPTVKFGTERLRIAPTPGHTVEDTNKLLKALTHAWRHVGLEPKHPRCNNNSCNCLNACSQHKGFLTDKLACLI